MRLYLLRHGEVTSHQGDVPITSRAERHAYEVGRRLGAREAGAIRILSGETKRAIDTARHLARGVADAGGRVSGPTVAFALRNPDLYLAGVRVNMVSSTEAFAQQVEGVSAHDVESLDFFTEFVASSDRIGWWLGLKTPPGEVADVVSSRIRSFAVSLADPVPDRHEVAVAVTHSPLIRAAGLEFLGRDVGEPPWVSGLMLSVGEDGTIEAELFEEGE